MPENDSKPKKERVKSQQLFAWLLSYGKPYRLSFALFTALSVVEVLIGLVVPWTMKILIDNVLGSQPIPSWLAPATNIFSLENKTSLLIAVCVAGFLIGLMSQLVSLLHTQLQVGIGQKMVLDLQRDLFGYLQKLSLRYHQQAGTGDAIYRLNNDAYCVSNIILHGLFPLVSSLLTLVLMLIILLRIQSSLALLSLVVIPPLFLAIHYYSTRLYERSERVKEMETGIFNLVHEVFSSIKLVKAFSREQHEQEKFVEKGAKTFSARLNVTLHESLFSFVISALTYLGTAAVLAVGGWHVLQGTLTIGELLVVIAYLGSVYGPLSAISYTIGHLQGSIASARRVYDTMNLQLEIEESAGAVEIKKLRGHIKFENVSFAYSDARPVLKNISFEVQPGQMIAVVGLTGAGKSTLVSLIPRFYDAASGTVSIDGVDVREMQLKQLREAISVVTQEPILFSSSVGDNIRYGKLDASHEQMVAAAEAAQAHDFIEQMPEGYNTLLGDSGSQLSGGERQRVSIARALLKNAPVLILDEPTSALDSRSESRIFTALQHLMKNRTTIVIAHRLSTIRNADKIIVLDGGQIAGEGSHEQLLQTNELYRELYERLLMGFGFDYVEPQSENDTAAAETNEFLAKAEAI
jgi:ATP-binding cassette subfamily B protein/subfamily B ATP-binding cassette protein MsbA